MPNLALVGAQWGDEGKGKVVDLLAGRFDVVARFQGGPNAGHTVTIGGERKALHHIPSGVFRPGTRNVIGNGTVLDLGRLLAEVEGLEAGGISLQGRLFISDRAHVILAPMARLDTLVESSFEGRIGTTRRGIGPTYEAKAGRVGIRVADLADPRALEERIRRLLEGSVGCRLRAAGEDPGDPRALAEEAHAQGGRIERFVADTSFWINHWMDEGCSVFFEGAQGTLLDVDHGAYPYVTSSNTTAAGLCAGLGVAPTRVHGVLGVAKAYATRVGSGPMPTELSGSEGLGDLLRERGREYGTTTGRPRRCGWFDGVAAAYAQRLNRFDGICVTLLDVLDVFDTVRVCVEYRLGGRPLQGLPAVLPREGEIEPVYEDLPGWNQDTSGVRSWEDLPANARRYLDRIGTLFGTEVAMVGVGPDRTQSIVRPDSWLARTFGSG